MGKIFMALRYGSMKTKLTLISIALLLIGGGAMIVLGINGMSLVKLGIGALLFIGGLLFMMTISFSENNPPEKNDEESNREGSNSEEYAGEVHINEDEPDDEPRNIKYKKILDDKGDNRQKISDLGMQNGSSAAFQRTQTGSQSSPAVSRRSQTGSQNRTVSSGNSRLPSRGESGTSQERTVVKTVKISGIETVIRQPGSSVQQGIPVIRENAGYVPEWQNDMIVTDIVENGGEEFNEPQVKYGIISENGEKANALSTDEQRNSESEGAEKKKNQEQNNKSGQKAVNKQNEALLRDFAERGVIANVREQQKTSSITPSAVSEEEDDAEQTAEEKKKKRRGIFKFLTDDNSNSELPEEKADTVRKKRNAKPDESVSAPVKNVALTKKQIQERKKLLRLKGGDKKHIPVFVDSFSSMKADRVPAYIQLKGKNVNVILIESALRTQVMPLSQFLKVTYERDVVENYPEYYDTLRLDKELSAVFGDMLPSLYHGTGRMGSEIEYKNRYILGGDLAVTPRSMRKLMVKFDFDFHVFDSLNIRGEYSDYFKMAYENRIFWTDNCISQTEYQNRTRRLLQTMVEDESLSNYDFKDELDLMVRNMLITREYADFYNARKTDGIKIRI